MRALVVCVGALLPAGVLAHGPLARTVAAGSIGAATAAALFTQLV